jgi:hypothetical protein
MFYAGPREACFPRHRSQKLRMHPFHHRSRPRWRGQLLSSLCSPRNL